MPACLPSFAHDHHILLLHIVQPAFLLPNACLYHCLLLLSCCLLPFTFYHYTHLHCFRGTERGLVVEIPKTRHFCDVSLHCVGARLLPVPIVLDLCCSLPYHLHGQTISLPPLWGLQFCAVCRTTSISARRAWTTPHTYPHHYPPPTATPTCLTPRHFWRCICARRLLPLTHPTLPSLRLQTGCLFVLCLVQPHMPAVVDVPLPQAGCYLFQCRWDTFSSPNTLLQPKLDLLPFWTITHYTHTPTAHLPTPYPPPTRTHYGTRIPHPPPTLPLQDFSPFLFCAFCLR